jgi:hypothetical protein
MREAAVYNQMLAAYSKSLRAAKMARMFCAPAGGLNPKFGSYNDLDSLVGKIDGDKPFLYCLLVTESWNPM